MNNYPVISSNIIAEMRDLAANRDWHNHTGQHNRERMLDLADRLEAALKCEKAEIEANALAAGGIVEAAAQRKTPGNAAAQRKTPGNAAAMRKALEAARDLLLPQCNGGTAFAKACGETVNKIMDALAAPPRNCDVGTAEEQGMRFKKFCHDHQASWHGCTNCPVLMSQECAIAWTQMPYEEGGAKCVS